MTRDVERSLDEDHLGCSPPSPGRPTPAAVVVLAVVILSNRRPPRKLHRNAEGWNKQTTQDLAGSHWNRDMDTASSMPSSRGVKQQRRERASGIGGREECPAYPALEFPVTRTSPLPPPPRAPRCWRHVPPAPLAAAGNARRTPRPSRATNSPSPPRKGWEQGPGRRDAVSARHPAGRGWWRASSRGGGWRSSGHTGKPGGRPRPVRPPHSRCSSWTWWSHGGTVNDGTRDVRRPFLSILNGRREEKQQGVLA